MPQADSSVSKQVTARMVQIMKALIHTDPHVKSQKDFSVAIGVHPLVTSRWVKHKASCTLENIVNACNRFRINPNYLILGIGDMFQDPGKTAIKNKLEHQVADIDIRLGEVELAVRKLQKGASKK